MNNDGNLWHTSNAIAFIDWVPLLNRVAFDAGYTLAIHGSLTRDFDLVAVPWTEAAIPEAEFVERIVKFAGAEKVLGPTAKPHGRVAYSVFVSAHTYLDLSVMPRRVLP